MKIINTYIVYSNIDVAFVKLHECIDSDGFKTMWYVETIENKKQIYEVDTNHVLKENWLK
jgi:hypothetical protein